MAGDFNLGVSYRTWLESGFAKINGMASITSKNINLCIVNNILSLYYGNNLIKINK